MIINETGLGYAITVDHGDHQSTIKIPSQRYPLKGEIIVVTDENTAPLGDNLIEDVFNAVKPREGRCYDNMAVLRQSLIKAGISEERITTLVGWMFFAEGLPVHHCFIMIDKKHILDYGPLRILDNLDTFANSSLEKIREDLARIVIEAQKGKNSEHYVFGQSNKNTIYFASVGTPEEGIETLKKLLKAFPKHPAIIPVNKNNLTPIQQLIQDMDK